NVSSGVGTNGADGFIQVRQAATNTVAGTGIFTNVHLADGASFNFGLGPGEATPRPHIIVDLALDGTTALVSTNADGSSPEFVRNVTATNAGTVMTVFGNTGTNLSNSNAPVGAKSINFAGALSPNVTVLNSESPASGVNLTSESN